MDPTTRAMFMGAAGAELRIGTFFEGGYFAGYISHTADGNATHGLIVAPAASGYNGKSTLQWKTSNTSTSGTSSEYDGAANTANMNDDHPAGFYCADLQINGYSDWYLPARYELEIAYYNLKPNSTSNNTAYGTNSYAVPQRLSNYTAGDPAQTSVAAFQSGGAEAFVSNYHWTSTESSSTKAWMLSTINGVQASDNPSFFPVGSLPDKTSLLYVRAFRKFAL